MFCVFFFSARDADEREKWIHALEGTILRHTLQLQVSHSLIFSDQLHSSSTVGTSPKPLSSAKEEKDFAQPFFF